MGGIVNKRWEAEQNLLEEAVPVRPWALTSGMVKKAPAPEHASILGQISGERFPFENCPSWGKHQRRMGGKPTHVPKTWPCTAPLCCPKAERRTQGLGTVVWCLQQGPALQHWGFHLVLAKVVSSFSDFPLLLYYILTTTPQRRQAGRAGPPWKGIGVQSTARPGPISAQ